MIKNIHEAKTHFSKLVDQAAAGEEVIIAKADKPVAKLVPYVEARKDRKPGGWEGKIWIVDDFDELPPDLLAAFNGEND